MFLVVEGDTWEYWEPGEYKNSDKEFSCMAIATDGLKIYLSQVKISIFHTKNILFKSSGFRVKLRRAGAAADAAQRAAEPRAGEEDEAGDQLRVPGVAEQGGLADHHPGNTRCWPQCVKTTSPVQGGTITQERTTPQQMRFNSSSSFQLLFGGEQFSQSYSCSKLLAAGEQEIRLQLFSQSQVGTRKITLSFLLTDK